MAVSASAESSHVTSETRRHVSMYEASERDHSASEWYFTRKEIEENSPSRRDGIDLKKESYLRKSYCTFLQDLGMRLKVPQVTIATAIIFCHRFFLRQSHAKNDRRTIATVCMFLAGKVEETPHSLNSVILVSYDIIHKKDPAARQRIKQKEVYEQQKELILLGERVVLTTLGFDLNVHHPYRPLVEAIKKFRVAQNALAQVAWNFVNDGLRTSLCLQYKPHHIAAGAIFLAAKFLKVKLPSDGDKVWWQEFDVTPRQLEDVSNQMLELYEQNHTVQASHGGSEVEGGSTSNVTVTRPLPPPKPASEDAVSASGRAVHHVGNAAAADDAANPSKSEGISDAMKKIDKDKVKAALEKRKQSRGSSLPRGAIDEDDLIEQELESGVELAAKDERKKASSMNGEVGMEESSAAEEGELSSVDCQEPHQRPKLSVAAANSKRPQHLESGDQQPPPSVRDSVEREPKRARHEAHL